MSDGFVCARCKRELAVKNWRAPEILDEEFRRAFPREAAATAPREEVCHECYEQLLKPAAEVQS